MDIKQRIQELSLDDKAKLYFMGLVRKGEIDTLPENPKAAYIKMVMDKADPSTMHDDPGDIRIDHDYYAEEKKEDYNKLKEIATELGYLSEGKLLNEEIKFIDYLTVDQDEFKALYDKHYDDDGHMEDFEEDFIRDFGVDFLSPNIEKINKYYGTKLSKYDVGELLTDFYEGDGLEFISSNEKFEFWLNRNSEFYF
tara:strand:- start:171 stop:758 length:588 start_codon:yes stop_codon:yes gene_type:complete